MIRFRGTIYTGQLDPATTDALLVDDAGRIAAAHEEAKRAGGAKIEEVSLGRRVAVPGFIDAHLHLQSVADRLTRLILDDAGSLDEVLALVADYAKSYPRDRVLLGMGWDEGDWPDPRIPERADLDRVAPNHAVVLRRICEHLWVVNSETLRLIAARKDLTPEQRGRLDAVSADGLLREADITLAAPLATPSPGEMSGRLLKATRHALSLGATGVHEFGWTREPIVELDRRGRLPIRVVIGIRPDWLDEATPAEVLAEITGRRVSPGPVKFFLDGSIGAHTAAVSVPFVDDPGNSGQLLWDDAVIEKTLERWHKAGMQLAIHAIGDRAIAQAVDVLARILGRHPRDDHRHRIEHAELATPELADRMASLGVIASMQPNFIGRWQNPGGLYEKRFGARGRRLNPLGTMLRAGVRLAFGSDGMPFGPLFGIGSAMEHPDPAERLTFVEALHAYTFGSAFAGRTERDRGTLDPGKFADVAVLSADPSNGTEARVEETFVGGKRTRVVP
jgi:hypothetical protein